MEILLKLLVSTFPRKVNLLNDIVNLTKVELEKLNSTPNGGHLKTGDIRKLSAKLYRSLNDKSKDNVFIISELLLEQRNWAMGVIAFDFAYRVKKKYDENIFSLFESWLISRKT